MKVFRSRVRAETEGPSPSSITSTSQATRSELVATAVLWITILLIHVACGAYYAFVALLYHSIPTTLVSTHMRSFRLTIDMENFPLLVGFFAICSALHAGFLLQMLVMSARQRKMFFHSQTFQRTTGVLPKIKSMRKIASDRVKAARLSMKDNNPRSAAPAAPSSASVKESLGRVEKAASRVWDRSFGVAGFFGVGSKHFALLFLIREAVEAVLQSIQAYTLSKYVPRAWLNRSAVALVAVSCWSTPAIRRLLSRSPRLELILSLLVDIVLDMASSIGVPVALGEMYLRDYNPELRDFETVKWFDNAWIANLDSEFKQLFIQSWFDFVTRALFAVAVLLSLDDVKLLAAASADVASKLLEASSSSSESVVVRLGRRAEKGVHVALVLWGFVILGLHFESAGSNADLTDCMVRVRPWLATKSTCAAMEIDCKKHAGMVGTAAELEARWTVFDAQALTLVIVRNCPELHMPASIRSFPQLTGLSLYYSTLVDWSASAALTRRHHPNLRQILLGFVNMTAACDSSSSLPPGLLARDFPTSLGAVVVAGTAFDKLPPDLHEIWPRGMNMRLMGDGFTALPDVVLRMEPVRLNLQYNKLKRLPAALFELPSLQWLEIGFNPSLSELPELLAEPSPALLELTFQGTNVSSLPNWMTSDTFLGRVRLAATKTPLCTQLLQNASSTERKALAGLLCVASS